MRRVLQGLAVLALVGIVGAVNFLRPVDGVAATQIVPSQQRVPGLPPDLPWPAGEAALGVAGAGLIGTHGDSSPRPMASVAKVMVALIVVADHPLKPAEPGEVVTVTPDDVANYQRESAAGQSVVAVAAGETLNQRQLLEGMLIPSGNNFADILARWDAGSLDAFVAKMNTRAAAMGMRSTHFADASGFSEQTVGNPADLVVAGEALMADPTLAQVVGEGQVDLPVAGTVYNVDYALGRAGIIGIKTGSAPKAGACFLFAAAAKIPGQLVTLVGAIMNEPTLDAAFAGAERLIAGAVPQLSLVAAISTTQAVAEYRSPWGSRTGLAAQKDILLVAWPGAVIHRRVDAPAANPPLADGEAAGTVSAWIGTGVHQSVPLATDGPLYEPGGFWRLTRPLSDTR